HGHTRRPQPALGLAAKRQTSEGLECPEIEKSHLDPRGRLDRQRKLLVVHGAGNDASTTWPRRARIHGRLRPSLHSEKAIADDTKDDRNRDKSRYAGDHHQSTHSRDNTGRLRIERLFIVVRHTLSHDR